MKYTVFFGFCLIFVLIGCNEDSLDKSVLSPMVTKVEYGSINVGQSQKYSTTIHNTSKRGMLIKNLSVCCGNPMPAIDREIIPPRGIAILKQEINKKKAGAFKITTKVKFSQPEGLVHIYEITGIAIQPITAKIGWSNASLTEVDFKGDIRLPEIHNNGKNLILSLTHDTDMSFLTEKKMNLTSKYFSLLDKTSKVDIKQQLNNESYKMILKPIGNFPIGEITDSLTIELEDQTKCVIPLIFRSIGNVYCEKSSMFLGTIANALISKKIKLFFHEDTPMWPKTEYAVEGKLSDAISVVSQTAVKDHLELAIEIDGNKLNKDNIGYLSSTVTFFSESNPVDSSKILLYGHR